MPLSEEELRLLEQMERALVEEDPKFAHTLRGTAFARRSRRRAVAAGGVFLVGVVVLMTGAITERAWVGIVGFLVMLAAAAVALTSWQGRGTEPAAPRETSHGGFGVVDGGRKGRSRTKAPSSGSFMDRMEERWRRRREGGY
ncbi:DUF3040 domain-containing protein [uncultured Nocardioides sp.]|uniref:DUF3040 domain-containing protein n=1 Tax=uncultured Nocardioides sp. TaxID=198441 RepID=UPI0025F22349|nr:DUF3040 domain-containing protein [uncultured Nocardioides sp.]